MERTPMNYRRFGRTGWNVSEIGYGMWGMAGWTGSEDAESIASLQRAVELGCNFFYTATKVPPKNRQWPSRREYSLDDCYPPEYIEEYVDKSLRNLGLKTLDLIQLHTWEDKWLDDRRLLPVIEKLRRSEKVRAFGISMNRWEPWNGVRAVRDGVVDAVQVIYNIFDQNPEDELFPACREKDVAVIARVPFDEGALTGALTLDSKWPAGDWRNTYFVAENLKATVERVEKLKTVRRGGISLAGMGVRFFLNNRDVG